MKAILVARTFACPRTNSEPLDADIGAALEREGIPYIDIQDVVLSVDNCYYVTVYIDPVRSEEQDRAAVERAVVSLGASWSETVPCPYCFQPVERTVRPDEIHECGEHCDRCSLPFGIDEDGDPYSQDDPRWTE